MENVGHVPWLIVLESSGNLARADSGGSNQSGWQSDILENWHVLSSQNQMFWRGQSYSVERVMNFLNRHEYISSKGSQDERSLRTRQVAESVKVRNDEHDIYMKNRG